MQTFYNETPKYKYNYTFFLVAGYSGKNKNRAIVTSTKKTSISLGSTQEVRPASQCTVACQNKKEVVMSAHSAVRDFIALSQAFVNSPCCTGSAGDLLCAQPANTESQSQGSIFPWRVWTKVWSIRSLGKMRTNCTLMPWLCSTLESVWVKLKCYQKTTILPNNSLFMLLYFCYHWFFLQVVPKDKLSGKKLKPNSGGGIEKFFTTQQLTIIKRILDVEVYDRLQKMCEQVDLSYHLHGLNLKTIKTISSPNKK